KTCPSVKAGRTPSASSSSGFSFREERNTSWIARQPWESTCFPLVVKVCPPQSKIAVTASYTKGSAAAHSSLQQTSRRILRSPTGSAGTSSFSSSRVGIRAWWSDTSLSFSSARTSGKNSGQASKGGTRAARCRTTEAVSAMSPVRY
ncbi:Fe-S cluster assembly scaffold protein NifU, partial [Dysosmobacter welbionis]